MVDKYGDRLFITGSLELQEQQLYVGVPVSNIKSVIKHFIH
jgi:hypothetical protein